MATTELNIDVFANASELIQDLAKKIKEMASIISEWCSSIRDVFLPKKWLHYAHYSKRARIRKKYNDKILRFWKVAIKSQE